MPSRTSFAERKLQIPVTGMTCQGCADSIQRALKREKGVQQASADWKAGSGVVLFDPETTSADAVLSNAVFQRGVYTADRAE